MLDLARVGFTRTGADYLLTLLRPCIPITRVPQTPCKHMERRGTVTPLLQAFKVPSILVLSCHIHSLLHRSNLWPTTLPTWQALAVKQQSLMVELVGSRNSQPSSTYVKGLLALKLCSQL
jgi:hypothetical protein